MLKISFVFILITFIIQSVFAESDQDVQRHTVTGTHIKRLDQEGTTPITVIDREQIEFSGASSLADLIRNLSFASFGVTTKNSGVSANGASYTSFRGLPYGYVLILLNGRRFPTDDINFIPISAIERVDILTDGASATYGSDAIGGVINFITKQGDIGSTASVGVSLPEPFVLPKKALKFQGWRSERWADVPKFKDNIFGFKGGEELNASFTHGWTEDDYQALFSLFYKEQRPVLMRDRPFAILSPRNFSSYGSPGTYKENGVLKTMDGCTTVIAEGPSAGYCGFDFSFAENQPAVSTLGAEIQPAVSTLGLFGVVTADVGDNSEIYTHLFFTYERSLGQVAPAPDRVSDFSDKQEWLIAIGKPDLQEFYYRTVEEGGAGRRQNHSNRYVFDINTGMTSYLKNNWNLETSWNNSGAIDISDMKNYSKKSEMFKVQDGKPLWDPFKPPGQKDDISYALYEPWATRYKLSSILETQLNGEVASLGDMGDIYSAFGVRLGYEHFKRNADSISWDKATSTSDQWGGGVVSTANGGRDWQTLYGEFVLPLSLDVLNSLELQIAGSVDRYGVDYPDLKDWKSVLDGKFITYNPKVSLKWQPSDVMAFRSSWGTGFMAPPLNLIHLDQVAHSPSGADMVRCQLEGNGKVDHPLCKSSQYNMVSYGNKDLKPETASFYNIGVAVAANENLSASIDYFFYHIKNKIDQAGDVSLMTTIEHKAYSGDKEAQDLAQNMNLEVDPPAPRTGQGIKQIDSRAFNAGDYKTNGLDLKLMASFPSDELGLTTYIQTQASYLFDIRIKEILEEDFKSKIGHWGYPVAKLQIQLGFQLKNAVHMAFSTRGTSRYNENSREEHAPDTLFQAGVKQVKKYVFKKEVKPGVKAVYTEEEVQDENTVLQIPNHFEFDFTLHLPLSAFNSQWSSKDSLLFKIENLLNSMPPESRRSGYNQRNLAGVNGVSGSGYYQPAGFYYTNGRVWKLQYIRKF